MTLNSLFVILLTAWNETTFQSINKFLFFHSTAAAQLVRPVFLISGTARENLLFRGHVFSIQEYRNTIMMSNLLHNLRSLKAGLHARFSVLELLACRIVFGYLTHLSFSLTLVLKRLVLLRAYEAL